MKAKKLRKMLIEKNMTSKTLAELTEISYNQVSRVLTGTSSGSLKWWKKAASVLNCDVSDIIE